MTGGQIERLARLAALAEPPALDDTGARRLVERAVIDARRPIAEHRRRTWPIAAGLACAAGLAFVLWPRGELRSSGELLHLALPTGDRITATAGVRFDIESLAPSSRHLRVRTGTMLFDVAHVVPDQRFVVTTDQIEVVARGTVFSVTADASTTQVHVFEGSVDVIEAGTVHALAAGASWATSGRAVQTAEIAAEAQVMMIARATASPPPARRIETTPQPVLAPPPPAPIAPPPPASRPPPPPAPQPATLADARAAVAAGRFADALAIVERVRAREDLDGAWYIVLADALRGSGRLAQAADALDLAAGKLSGAARAEAAYSSAYLRSRELHDADGALAALTAGDVDDIGSPFEERGLALRAEILASLHRDADAAEAATHYLDRFPHGDLARYMQSLAKR